MTTTRSYKENVRLPHLAMFITNYHAKIIVISSAGLRLLDALAILQLNGILIMTF